jgi:hypothetical protein
MRRIRPLRFANYDVTVGAVDNCFQFLLFRTGYAKLVECLLKIVHERIPFFGRDVQMLMRLTHRASGIFLRAAARPADHFGNEILETGWRDLVVSFVHSGGDQS